jgi:acetoin utilization deacetylase AcuC-like enzyme
MTSKSILVVSLFHPEAIELDEDGGAMLDDFAKRNDDLDHFNHPRYRRAMILKELAKRGDDILFETPTQPCLDLLAYQNVHSERLVTFFSTAWDRWDALGTAGQDPSSILPFIIGEKKDEGISPPLIPGNYALPRDPYQRPSQNVMGQIGFFCTDDCAPVFALLKEELLWDGAVVQQAVASIQNHKVVYALTTHPGHHAAKDSFGGYCYLNHAAFAARLLQNSGYAKVAVLDIDYVRRKAKVVSTVASIS